MNTVQHKFAVSYPNLGRFVHDFTAKIETTGLSLKTTKLVVVGQLVGMHFRFQDGTPEVLAFGDIAWVDSNADPSGKVSFLIKNIRLDDVSRQRIGQYVQSGGANAPEEVEEVTPAGFAPSPSLPPAHEQAPVHHATSTPSPRGVPPITAPTPGNTSRAPKKKKLIVALLLTVLFGGMAGWVFGLGGLEFIMSRFVKAPGKPLDPPAMIESITGIEPPLPAFRKAVKPRPKPRPVPPGTLSEIDPVQGATFNKFILYFDRRPGSVDGNIFTDPPRYELVVRHARSAMKKPQLFLPFTFIRTISAETDGDLLRVTFLATQKYVPRVVYEWDGNELTVMFLASD